MPRFAFKHFPFVRKSAVFTKLRTVWDGLGHFWTVLDKILCYNGTVKKGKSVGGSSAGAFSLPKSERKWVPCDSPSSAHKRHSPFSPNGPTVWYPVSNQRRLILFSFPHHLRQQIVFSKLVNKSVSTPFEKFPMKLKNFPMDVR